MRFAFPFFFPGTENTGSVADVPAIRNPVRNNDAGDLHLCNNRSCKVFHDTGAFSIQRSEGLIEHQQQRLYCQSACQRHPLFLPAGKVPGFYLGMVLQFHKSGQVLHAFCNFLPGKFPDPEAKSNILMHGHVGKHGTVLEDIPYTTIFDRQIDSVLQVYRREFR